MLPDKIKERDGIHMAPCCKKFLLILPSRTGKKKQQQFTGY